MLTLYEPDKYGVIQGAETNVALCTCWSEPEQLVKQQPELKEQYAIISTLIPTREQVVDYLKDHKPTKKSVKKYMRGCFDPRKARLYGTFQERAALNTTQFFLIQGSLLIRMGYVFNEWLDFVQRTIPGEPMIDLPGGATINLELYVAGYIAYLEEVQLGLSKYPMDGIKFLGKKAASYVPPQNLFKSRPDRTVYGA